jgi:hypothetical protein
MLRIDESKMNSLNTNKKGDMPMWLIGLILALVVLLVLLFIIAKSGEFSFGFLDWLRGTI